MPFLEHLDLSIDPGHFIAIAGPSRIRKDHSNAYDCRSIETSKRHGNKSSRITFKVGNDFQDLQLADGATSLINVLGGSLGRHSFFQLFLAFQKKNESARKLLSNLG